jgi:hypothetical protein
VGKILKELQDPNEQALHVVMVDWEITIPEANSPLSDSWTTALSTSVAPGSVLSIQISKDQS